MKKTFLVTMDFEKDCCPYAQDTGCEHPSNLVYFTCDGNSQPDGCPLVPVSDRGLNFDEERMWREE